MIRLPISDSKERFETAVKDVDQLVDKGKTLGEITSNLQINCNLKFLSRRFCILKPKLERNRNECREETNSTEIISASAS
jgi:hypothetical protein